MEGDRGRPAAPPWRRARPVEAGREAARGPTLGVIVLVQILTHGVLAFGPLGPEAAAQGVAAALAASAAAGLAVALLAASRPLVGTTAGSLALGTAAVLDAAADAAGGIPPGLGEAVTLSALLELATGAVLLASAASGLGRAAGLIPQPVRAELVNGVAALLVISQAPAALGLLPWPSAPLDPAGWRPASLLVAVATTALALAGPRLPGLPRPVLAVAAGALLHHALAAALGGNALGPVFGAAPGPALLAEGWRAGAAAVPRLLTAAPLDAARFVLPAAASLALLGALETLTATGALRDAPRRRVPTRPDLAAVGAANLAAAAGGGLPVAASLSGSVACWRMGSRGRGAPLVRAAVPVAVLLALAPLLAWLPYAAMAGLVFAAAAGLADPQSLAPPVLLRRADGPADPRLRAARRRAAGDAVAVAAVVAAAVAFGLVAAVGLGAVLALVAFAAGMARVAVRRGWSSPAGRSRVRRGPAAELVLLALGGRIAVLELQGAVFFGSAEAVAARVERAAAAGAEVVVLDLGRVTRLDLAGARELARLAAAPPGGARVLLAPLHPGGAAAEELAELGLEAAVPEEARCATLEAAFEAAVLRGAEGAGAAGDDALDAAAALRGLGLRPAAARAVLARAEEAAYAPGEALIPHGDPAGDVFVLLAGRVAVSLPPAAPGAPPTLLAVVAPGAPPTLLAVVAPGALCGEAALLDGGPSSADVVARGDAGPVRRLRLGVAQVEALRREAPDAAWHLLTAMARQLGGNLRLANRAIAQMRE